MKVNKVIPKPSKQQYKWQEMERLMFVHLDPATWQKREYDNHSTNLKEINPELLNTDQWCEAAMSFGAKMIVYVAKHCGGFCWWNTETSSYGIKETPYQDGKGDVLGQISKSCQKYKLDLGIYIYPGDETWGAPIGSGGRTEDPSKQEEYNKIHRQQLTEVLSRYGKISEVWFDGSSIIPVRDILNEYANDAVIFQGPHASIRWCGTESGETPYPSWNTLEKKKLESGVSTSFDSDVIGDVWAPIEVDTPLYNHFWFWSEEAMSKRKTLDELMDVYYKSVGRGAVLLLNASPTTTGLIHQDDMKRYKEFGEEIKRRFNYPIEQTSGVGEYITLDFKKEKEINHIVIMEEYSDGQKVRKYALEAHTEKGWSKILIGSAIGRMRIDVFETIIADKIRLKIVESVGEPKIRSLKAFNVTNIDLARLIKNVQPTICDSNEWIEVGTWNTEELEGNCLEIDVSLYINEATQYELMLKTDENFEHIQNLICHKTLILEGVEVPEMISQISNENVFNINRTAVTLGNGEESTIVKIIFSNTISFGKILFRKRKY